MNAGMKNGINLLMILVLFISCVQEKEDNNVLRRVEACMELFPDSALNATKWVMRYYPVFKCLVDAGTEFVEVTDLAVL